MATALVTSALPTAGRSTPAIGHYTHYSHHSLTTVAHPGVQSRTSAMALCVPPTAAGLFIARAVAARRWSLPGHVHGSSIVTVTVQVVVCWRRLPRAPQGALVQRRLHQRRRALCPKRPPWHLCGRTDVWVVHLRPHQPRRRVNRIGGWCVYVHVRGWRHHHRVGRRLWEAAASRGNPRTRGNGPSSDAVAPHTSTGTQTSKQSPLQGKMVHHY